MPKAKISIPAGYDPRTPEGTTALVDIPTDHTKETLHKAVSDYLYARYGPSQVGSAPAGATPPPQNVTREIQRTPTKPVGFLPNLKESTKGLLSAPLQAARVMADPSMAMAHNLPTPVQGASEMPMEDYPGVSDVARIQAGDYSGEAGSLLPMAATAALGMSPKLRAGGMGAIRGGYEGGFKETIPVNYRGFHADVPAVVAGAGGGALMGEALGWPAGGAGAAFGRNLGAVVGGALPVVKGAATGARDASAGQPWLNPSIMNFLGKGPLQAEFVDPVWEQMGRPPYTGQQPLLDAGPQHVYNMGDPQTTHYPPGTGPEFNPQYPPLALPPGTEGGFQGQARPMPGATLPTQRQPLGLPAPATQQLDLFHDVPEFSPTRTQGAIPLGPEYNPKGEVTYTRGGAAAPTKPVTVKTQEEIVKQGVKDEPKGKATKETKPSSVEDKTTEGDKGSAGPEKAKAPKAILSILAEADPSWNGEDQLTYAHLKKAADSLGVSAGPFARYLIERGFEVEPSKFDPSGKYGLGRLGKKELTDDKFMNTLKKLTSE